MNPTKVLVVDDDPGSRDLLTEVLAANGYLVAAVADGAAAREELARDGQYGIVIADLRMPNITGLDLLRDLQGRNHGQDLILMSSFLSGADKQQALELGARALLEKPFRLTELLDVVGDLAERRSVGVKL
ncbi:MAG TPA: response regulator [Terriglobia bacterium]|nr:response regulator [Terriglobia bacterium]